MKLLANGVGRAVWRHMLDRRAASRWCRPPESGHRPEPADQPRQPAL